MKESIIEMATNTSAIDKEINFKGFEKFAKVVEFEENKLFQLNQEQSSNCL
jgi:hypothetical protein